MWRRSILIFLFLFIFAFLPFFYLSSTTRSSSSRDICDRALYPPPWKLRSDQLTVLISGFSEARIHLLHQIALAYSASPIVHSVFILWSNTSTPPSRLRSTDFLSAGAPVFLLRQASLSLNDRFLPRVFVKTRAILICDDDVSVELQSLSFAFQVWKDNRHRIVGFFSRSHEYLVSTKSWIYTIHPDRYSIMLTKAMILATDFLFLYTCNMPPGVKAYVDVAMNCEDIAINFLVSNYTSQGPLLVEGKPRDWGDTRNSNADLSTAALSARGEYRKNRGDCITQFHRLWHCMPLRYSFSKATDNVEEQALCEKSGIVLPCNHNKIGAS